MIEKILKKKGRKEIIFSDFTQYLVEEDKKKISTLPLKDKWHIREFEIEKCTGKILYSMSQGYPETITVDFGLKGYYAIFVGVDTAASNIQLRLNGDSTPDNLHLGQFVWSWRRRIDELFWCVADMTGRKIEISKAKGVPAHNASVAQFTFLELTKEEYEIIIEDKKNPKNKRLNAVCDMDLISLYGNRTTEESWRELLKPAIDGDFDSYSVEDVYQRISFESQYVKGVNAADLNGPWMSCHEYFKEVSVERYEELLKHFIQYGQDNGIKMFVAIRAGLWECDAPNDRFSVANWFYSEHQDCMPVDRDGVKIKTLSLAFDKVQDWFIQRFIRLAELGADGVELMVNRTPITMLFEEPVCVRFKEKFGFDPKQLPLCDERLIEVKCDIFTEFMQKLRNTLNEKGYGHTQINLRCLFSLYDNKLQGVDLERLAKAGLVDNIISYPLIQRERNIAELKDEDGLIDIAKYTEYLRTNDGLRMNDRQDHSGPNDLFFIPPSENFYGELVGPKTQAERIQEFVAIGKKYNVTIYFDLLPRDISPQRAKKYLRVYYDNGAEKFSLWDSYNRWNLYRKFCFLKRVGHKEEMFKFGTGEGVFYKHYKLIRIDDFNLVRYLGAWGG